MNSTGLKRLRLLPATLLIALPLAACQTTGSVETKAAPAPRLGATFCQIAVPFRWSSHDTRESQEQAVIHNAKGRALCGWGKK